MAKLDARRRLRTLVLFGLAVAATSCGYYSPADPASSRFNTDPYEEGDDEATFDIIAGETASWVNRDTRPHTVTADDGSFDSGSLAPGAAFSHRFETPGTFSYHCTLHDEKGAIKVAAEGASARFADYPTPTTSPSRRDDDEEDADLNPTPRRSDSPVEGGACEAGDDRNGCPDLPDPVPSPSPTKKPCPPPSSQQKPPAGCATSGSGWH